MKQPISLCMIARDEQENLRACLAPLVDLVHELIVVDTGSTDDTKGIAAELGAKVHDFPWVDDFSAARNESLRHATSRWIFWIDADDRIDSANREKLATLFGQLTEEAWRRNSVYVMECKSAIEATGESNMAVSHVRLFPNTPSLAWRGRVHESVTPVESSAAIPVCWSDVVIQHTGYADPLRRRRKRQRDLRLLQLEYATNPDDSGTLFYLGWIYLELGNPQQGLPLLRRSLRREPNPLSARARKARGLIVASLNALGRFREAMEESSNALAAFADDPELLFHQAFAREKLSDWAGAEACYLRLLNARPADYFRFSVAEGLNGAAAHHRLGMLYKQTGRLVEAELHLRAALAERPTNCEAWASLGQLCLWTGRPSEAEEVTQRLARCPRAGALASTLQAQCFVAEGRYDEARSLLERLIARDRSAGWPRMVLGELLFVLGNDLQRCIEVYEELIQLQPSNDFLRQRLEQLLRRHASRAASHAGQPVAADVPAGAFLLAG